MNDLGWFGQDKCSNRVLHITSAATKPTDHFLIAVVVLSMSFSFVIPYNFVFHYLSLYFSRGLVPHSCSAKLGSAAQLRTPGIFTYFIPALHIPL
jgi:hypothetical protein